MLRKCSILASVFLTSGMILASESLPLPESTGTFLVPAGWHRVAAAGLVLRGPGNEAADAPRLVLTVVPGDLAATATSLKDGWKRVTDGCEILDDDNEPLGGRVWRRIRVRFAAGPLAFGQAAWIGSVNGRTVVAMLSAPDDRIGSHLASVTAAIATIRSNR